MARKKKTTKKRRQEEDEEEYFLGLNPETKIGIVAVALFAIAAILLLAYFNLAGTAGEAVDYGLAFLFGMDRFLVPIIFLIIGANLLYPEHIRLSAYNYIGLVFFFLSFNGMVNLFAFKSSSATTETIMNNGGYIGELLNYVLGNIFGFWGGFVTITALLVVSIMLIFNTSLRSVMSLHTHITGPFGRLLHRGGSADEEDEEWLEGDEEWEAGEEDEEDYEEGEEEDEGGEEKEERKPKSNSVETDLETALTTRRHRKIDLPFDLLEHRGSKPKSGDIKNNTEIIRKTFEQFGVDVEMGDSSVGPTVTQYTLRPSQGVKLSRIVSLNNDLALALAAHPIRIEAPIPGKSLVGIEVPNQSVAMVSLRELIESKPFQRRSTNLTVALGKDVAGKVWAMPIEKMPHMLVAGATGSGKSVCLNTMIVSLLYQNGPDDLKFIMVDPKRVELTAYTGLPHLLVPPITKVDETVNALKWTVREMERRLEVLSKFGARDIQSFNARSKDKMPKVVVVIDELADLMTSAAHEVEGAIIRIAQMARATGIHLILATQRPSVDVITGLIKANIPCRVAFAVASQMDSRTILDSSGAEKLLGRGDMLFTSAEISKPKRLQGAFVSDKEIERIVKFLKQEETPDYNYEITEKQKSGSSFGAGDEDEPLLEEAVEIVMNAGKASTSLLQRRLKVGYARAARIIDILEEQGIVGPAEGSKPREILVDEMPGGENDWEDVEEEDGVEEEDFEENEDGYEEREEDMEDDDAEEYEESEEEEEEEEEYEDEDEDNKDDEEERDL